MKKKEFIFMCRKCHHSLYVDKGQVKTLLTTDCPECGEERGELWVLSGEGNFDDLST